MERDDYYRILGVSRHASCDAVKRAFRSRVSVVHPDRNPGEPRAADNTRKLIEAYRVLANPPRRRDYDMADTRNARPVAIVTERAPHFHSPSGSRAMAMIIATFVVAFLALLVARSILAEQPRVFRPFVGAIDLSATEDEAIVVCLGSPDQLDRNSPPDHITRWPVLRGIGKMGEALVVAQPVERLIASPKLPTPTNDH